MLASNIESLKKELKLLIDQGKHIYLWDKEYTDAEMAMWCMDHNLYDYIWDYKTKDSMNYQCPDFVIDPSEKIINMFKNQGIPGNLVEKL